MRAVRGFEQFRERGKEQLLNGLADNHTDTTSFLPHRLQCNCDGLTSSISATRAAANKLV